jgi:hypothetical protein
MAWWWKPRQASSHSASGRRSVGELTENEWRRACNPRPLLAICGLHPRRAESAPHQRYVPQLIANAKGGVIIEEGEIVSAAAAGLT